MTGELTPQTPTERALWRSWLVVTTLIVLLILSVGVAYIYQQQAATSRHETATAQQAAATARRAAEIAECVNLNLGLRQAPQQAESKATRDFYTALSRTFSETDRVKAAASFKKAFGTYLAALNSAQTERDKHPLGQC